MIAIVARDLQRCPARQQQREQVPPTVRDGDKRDHAAIRRDCGSFVHAGEVGQPLKLHRPRRDVDHRGGDRVRRIAIEPRVADVAQPPAGIFCQAQLQQLPQ